MQYAAACQGKSGGQSSAARSLGCSAARLLGRSVAQWLSGSVAQPLSRPAAPPLSRLTEEAGILASKTNPIG